VAQFDKEASQTRDYCVAKDATHRAAHPDPSLRKGRLLGMTIKLSHLATVSLGLPSMTPKLGLQVFSA